MPRSRYSFTRIKNDRLTNNQVYVPTLYPSIPIEDDDLFVIAKDGERMDNIAYKYYGDTSYWWIIARANNIENGKFALDAGTEIRIPADLGAVMTLLEEKNQLM